MDSWYQRNKEHAQMTQKKYKSTPEFKQYRREHDRKNREHINELKRKWRNGIGKEKEKISKQKSDKKYYIKVKNEEEFKRKKQEYQKQYYQNNKEKIAKYGRQYRKNNPEKERKRHKKYQQENPKSNRSGSIDLQLAMNNVRKRDKNTCQWYNCGLTFREAPIHVHHIFPRSEYPDWELVEQYMICYCANHHGLWHRYRGDRFHNFIGSKEIESVYVRGRD